MLPYLIILGLCIKISFVISGACVAFLNEWVSGLIGFTKTMKNVMKFKFPSIDNDSVDSRDGAQIQWVVGWLNIAFVNKKDVYFNNQWEDLIYEKIE